MLAAGRAGAREKAPAPEGGGQSVTRAAGPDEMVWLGGLCLGLGLLSGLGEDGPDLGGGSERHA